MIVVTGGAGFIGSNLIAGLEARGVTDIAVVDRLGSDGKWRNIAKREIVALVPPEDLFAVLDGDTAIDTVFHLGAVTSTLEPDADLVARTNFSLSSRIWQWCVKRQARFIYASSAATYGDGSSGFDDEPTVAALARLKPLNAYGWSKHLFDRFVARQAQSQKTRPLQWAGLKFFNVYGPNEYHKGAMRSVVHQSYVDIAAGKPAYLFRSYRSDIADGEQKRDFIWVGDCIDVLLWLHDNPSVSGLFNCGTGQARSFLDLVQATFAAAGQADEISFMEMPAELQERYQYFTEARIDRLRAAGYEAPFTPLAEGVRRYVQDYLATSDPYL